MTTALEALKRNNPWMIKEWRDKGLEVYEMFDRDYSRAVLVVKHNGIERNEWISPYISTAKLYGIILNMVNSIKNERAQKPVWYNFNAVGGTGSVCVAGDATDAEIRAAIAQKLNIKYIKSGENHNA